MDCEEFGLYPKETKDWDNIVNLAQQEEGV
jgi:hypothetical protein